MKSAKEEKLNRKCRFEIVDEKAMEGLTEKVMLNI